MPTECMVFFTGYFRRGHPTMKSYTFWSRRLFASGAKGGVSTVISAPRWPVCGPSIAQALWIEG